MKTLQEVMGSTPPFKPTTDSVTVMAVLRDGKKTLLNPYKDSLEMECQDCGSMEGYTCWDSSHRCWFCANEKCLEKDTQITKKLARRARHYDY